MEQTDTTEQFVRRLTEHQNRLYGYIYSLLGDHSRSADVVQETNLVLWRKIGEFRPEQPFLPWAFAIARFQVLAHLRDQKRDKLLLDAELAESMGRDIESRSENLESVQTALRGCIQQLASQNRELIEQRYFQGQSIAELAETTARSVSSIKVALLRCRRQLADCVERKLAVDN